MSKTKAEYEAEKKADEVVVDTTYNQLNPGEKYARYHVVYDPGSRPQNYKLIHHDPAAMCAVLQDLDYVAP
jgi:hypothetical protein